MCESHNNQDIDNTWSKEHMDNKKKNISNNDIKGEKTNNQRINNKNININNK